MKKVVSAGNRREISLEAVGFEGGERERNGAAREERWRREKRRRSISGGLCPGRAGLEREGVRGRERLKRGN